MWKNLCVRIEKMRKLLFLILLVGFFAATLPRSVHAVSNNKFGIHIAVPSDDDIWDAASLVNSSGGDWGYITLVIEEKDKDRQKWQTVFNKLRELHLIPIIRLAASFEKNAWRAPETKDIAEWVSFLDSLNWVIENRYVVLFNEPNHADEWGGKVDPKQYAKIALDFSKALKEKNKSFFVMLAGFDAASPHSLPKFEDESLFIKEMAKSLPGGLNDLFDNVDGWASHSYPNHGFVGSPTAWGRNSIRTYLWELDLLRDLGIKKDLPVFITETGWPHAEGITTQFGLFNEAKVARNYVIALSSLIDDPRVVAVTPFLLNYQGEPFDHFSWRKYGQEVFYSQYNAVSEMPKKKGSPVQFQQISFASKLPSKLIEDSSYQIPIWIKNEGQAIWTSRDGYSMNFLVDNGQIEGFFSDIPITRPLDETLVYLHLKTKKPAALMNVSVYMQKDKQVVGDKIVWQLEIIPAIKAKIVASLFPKISTNASDFEFLIYDDKENLVFKRTNIAVAKGLGLVDDIHNLAIGEKYRFVLLKNGYLPRQSIGVLTEGENRIIFRRMLPCDFDNDGKLSLADVWSVIKRPSKLKILWPK